MKRTVIASLLAVAVIAASSPAFALSFSVDVPYQFTFASGYLAEKKNGKLDSTTADSVSGVIVGMSFGWFGVGYEKYDVVGKSTPIANITLTATQSYQFYDVFLDLPMRWLNFAVGAGKGKMNTVFDEGNCPCAPPKIDATDVSQYFVRVGVPLGKVFDVHVGYSAITAEDATIHNPPPGTGPKRWIGGTGSLITAGVRAGW